MMNNSSNTNNDVSISKVGGRSGAAGVGTCTDQRNGGGEAVERINWVSGQVVDAAVKIHSAIGPGLIESVYEAVLCRKLARRGLTVVRQKRISFTYEDMLFENVGRADMIVENALIVEVKSAAVLAPIHHKQLLTYLRLLDHRLGLVLNFGAPLMKDGIHRVPNRL